MLNIINVFNKKSKETEEEIFWSWFIPKSNEYYQFENNQDKLFKELGDRLKKLDRNLTFQFSSKDKKGRREFVISVEGAKDSFPSVLKLTKIAPKLEKWEIIPFRQKVKDFQKLVIKLGSISLNPKDIYFQDLNEGEKIGLNLYIKNYNQDQKSYGSAAFIVLDYALGEYDLATKIGGIKFHEITDDIDKSQLKSIGQLPKIIH